MIADDARDGVRANMEVPADFADVYPRYADECAPMSIARAWHVIGALMLAECRTAIERTQRR